MLLLRPELCVCGFQLLGPQLFLPWVRWVLSAFFLLIPIIEVEQGRGIFVMGVYDAPFEGDFMLALCHEAFVQAMVVSPARIRVRGRLGPCCEEFIDGVHDMVHHPNEHVVCGKRMHMTSHAVARGFCGIA